MKLFNSFRTKIALLSIGGVAMSFLVMGTVFHVLIVQQHWEDVEYQAKAAAADTAERVGDWCRQNDQPLSRIAESTTLQRSLQALTLAPSGSTEEFLARHELDRYLEEVLTAQDSLLEVSIHQSESEVQLAAARFDGQIEALSDKWYQVAQHIRNGSHSTPIFSSVDPLPAEDGELETGVPTMLLFKRIVVEEREVGILAARPNLMKLYSLMREHLRHHSPYRSSDVYLIDQQARIVSPTRYSDDLLANGRIQRRTALELRAANPFNDALTVAAEGKKLLGEDLGVAVETSCMEPYLDYRGVPVIGAWDVVPGQDWLCLAEFSEADVMAPIDKFTRVGWGLMLAASLIVGMIVHVGAKKGIQILNQLTHVATALASGDHSPRCKVTRTDELGLLANALDNMADEVVRALATLEAEVALRRNAEEELQRANEGLEDRVAARTKVAEEAAAEVRKLSLAIEQSSASVVITDRNARIEYVNPGFTKNTGYSAAEVIGQNPRVLNSGVHPPEFFAQMWQMLAAGQVWRGEICNRRKNGELFWEDTSIAPVFDESGETTNYVAVKVNTSERRRYEAELEKAKCVAEQASLAKSQFLANMSHELRTPLNGVIGMTELLTNTALDRRQRQFVEACHCSGKSLLMLINDILDFSKIEAGKLELEDAEFELDKVVEETVSVMGSQATDKGLNLFAHVSPELNAGAIGDSMRLRQILVNLIGNAIKFTTDGEVNVRVTPVGERASELVRFEVTDKGVGIPPDRLDVLFDSFTQADSSTTRKYGGTGLGLTISKSLVELMNGQIGVESEMGQGSTFWFEIPLQFSVGNFTRPQPSANLRDRRVLLLVESATFEQHLSEMLRDWQLATETTGTIESALSTLAAASSVGKPFDLLVVDEHKVPNPKLSEFAQQLRAKPENRDLRLFYFSAPDEMPDGRQQNEFRIDTCLSTPICQSTMLNALTDSFASTTGNSAIDLVPADKLETPSMLAGRRILLAEDNSTNQLFASEVLKHAGMHCDCVANGEEALIAVRFQPYDLILMDCQMPGMDGFQATQTIRRMEQDGELNGHLAIIALTANAIKGDRERCIEAGMDDYISKPFDPQELLRLMERLLGSDSVTPAEEVNEWETTELAEPLTINQEELITRCMGNFNFARELLADFEAGLPGRIEEVSRFVESGDAEDAGEAAHALKGAAGIVGAEAVQRIAAKLEAAGKSGRLRAVTTLLGELHATTRQFLEAASEVAGKLASQPEYTENDANIQPGVSDNALTSANLTTGVNNV